MGVSGGFCRRTIGDLQNATQTSLRRLKVKSRHSCGITRASQAGAGAEQSVRAGFYGQFTWSAARRIGSVVFKRSALAQ